MNGGVNKKYPLNIEMKYIGLRNIVQTDAVFLSSNYTLFNFTKFSVISKYLSVTNLMGKTVLSTENSNLI